VEDVVRLEAVLLPDKTRIAVMPPAIVRCTFAEAVVHWVREDVAPSLRALGSPLRSIDNYAAYDCRGVNRVAGAKLSEHGRANALDMRSFKLANGTAVELTDPQVSKDFRLDLRRRTCARFATVLGPGSDGYHENHIHRGAHRRPPLVPLGGTRARGGNRGRAAAAAAAGSARSMTQTTALPACFGGAGRF
jgi:hypothetical protein